jgi:hypothetical protein
MRNIATVTGTPPNGLPPVVSPPDTLKIVTLLPSIELIKSVSSVTDVNANGFTDAGDVVNFSFSVTNTGNTILSNVTINDAKLGLTGAACVGTLAPGATATCSTVGMYTLLQADIIKGGLENIATTTGTPVDVMGELLVGVTSPVDTSDAGTAPNGTTVMNPKGTETPNPLGENPNSPTDPTSDPTTFTVPPAPRIELIKSLVSVKDVNGNGYIDVADSAYFSFKVINTGNVQLNSVTITDAKLGVSGANCVTQLGVGQMATCAAMGGYKLTQADIDAGGMENTAIASGVPVNNNGTLIDINGDGDTSNDAVRDSSDTGTEPTNGGTITTVADPKSVETPDLDYVNGNNNDTDPRNDVTSLIIDPAPRMELVKSVSRSVDVDGNGFINAGDSIYYSFVVKNTGNVALGTVTIADAKLGISGAACVSTLAVGATATCTAMPGYEITQMDVDRKGVENIAEATGTPINSVTLAPLTGPLGTPLPMVKDSSDAGTAPNGTPVVNPNTTETPSPLGDNPNDPNDPTKDPTTFTIVPKPSIELIKSVSSVTDVNTNGFTDAGDIVTYSFTVKNTGNVILGPVSINDAKLGIISATCVTNLPVGATLPCITSPTYTILQSDIVAGGIENVALATGIPIDVSGMPLVGVPNAVDSSDAGTAPNGSPVTNPGGTETPSPLGQNPNSPTDPTSDPTTLIIPRIAEIGVAKAVSGVAPASSGVQGNYDVSYSFVIKNNGNVHLDSISLIDNFAQQFGGAFVKVVNLPVASRGGINGAYTASGTQIEMLNRLAILAPDSSMTVTVTVELNPGSPTAIYNVEGLLENQGTVEGYPVDPLGNPIKSLAGDNLPPVTDKSDSGTDPKGNNPGEPGDKGTPNDPTPLMLPNIGLAKKVVGIIPAASGTDGNFDVTLSYKVTNNGTNRLINLSLIDNIAAQYGAAFVGVTTSPSLVLNTATAGPVVNPAYAGSGDLLIPSTADTLRTGQSYTVNVTIEVDPSTITDTLFNSAITRGQPINGNGAPQGPVVSDISDSGSNTMGTNPGEPGDKGTPDDPTPLNLPAIGVAKMASAPVAIVGQAGKYNITYSFIIQNIGNTYLENVSLTDNLKGQLGAAFINLVPNSLSITGGTANVLGTINPAFTGLAAPNDEMLSKTAKMAPGQTITLQLSVVVDGTLPSNPLINQALASGKPTDSTGRPIKDAQGNNIPSVTDLSDAGANPKGGDDPTVVTLDCPIDIYCPADIIQQNDIDWCMARVTTPKPTALICSSINLATIQYRYRITGATTGSGTGFIPAMNFNVGLSTVQYILNASDFFGNNFADTCTFTVTVIDKQKPELAGGFPVDEIVSCNAVPTPFPLTTDNFIDNCTTSDSLKLAFLQTTTKGIDPAICSFYTYTLTNTWTVTDSSGNSRDFVQRIFVKDTIAPFFRLENDTVSCELVNTAKGILGLIDTCAANQYLTIDTVEVSTQDPNLRNCGHYNYTLTRTYTVTDPCGNSTSKTHVIIVEDKKAPVLTCAPGTVYLDNTGNVVLSGNLFISNVDDNCAPDSVLTVRVVGRSTLTCTDRGTREVTITVADPCGNISTCTTTVTVLDTIKPVFIVKPLDVTVQLDPRECKVCLADLPLSSQPVATDNCNVTLTYSPNILTNCIPIGDNRIIVTACDSSGNCVNDTFNVRVLEFVPISTDIACGNNINLSLDASCKATITAGMILQGNNYGCIDDYIVLVSETMNGPAIVGSPMVTDAHIGKRLFVSIKDPVSGNSCWGTVLVELKLAPVITCPANITIDCNQDFTDLNLTGRLVVTSCAPGVKVTYRDVVVNNGTCGTPRVVITRTWTAESRDGVKSTCTQTITVQKLDITKLVFPLDRNFATALSCSAVSANPNLTKPEFTGFPMIGNKSVFGKNYCDINVGYWDEVLQDVNCPGSYEILRNWVIRDECKPLSATNPIRHTQSIKVEDNTPPTMRAIADVTISTNAWSCDGDYELPRVVESDNCTDYTVVWSTTDGSIVGNRVEGLPIGQTTLFARAEDACGNISYVSFKITVVDKVAPVATAKQFITVSLTENGSDGVPGVAKLFGQNFDNGSYDNCSKIRLEVRRDDGAPRCSNDGNLYDHDNNASTPMIRWNNNVTYNNDGHTFDSQFDTDSAKYVKFCCEDIGKEVKVWLRVWDDAGNYNETWSIVKVEDKTLPKLECRPVAKFCDEAVYYQTAPVWEVYSKSTSKIDSSTVPNMKSICGNYGLEFRDLATINTCNDGSVVRRWRIVGTSVVCDQIITIALRPRTAVLDFPIALHIWNKCTLTEAEVLANTIKSTKTPQYGGNGDGGSVSANAPFVSTYRNTGCEVFGRKVKIDEFTVGDGCKKWRVTFEYINWCDNSDAGSRTTVFKYEDTTAPVINVAARDTIALGSNCNATYTTKATGTDSGGCSQGFTWEVKVTGVGYTQTRAGIGATPVLTFTSLTGGTYQVSYKLTDGCGNVTEKQSTLVVLSKAPTPYCVDISSAVMKNGVVELWAKDFDKGSFANCSGSLIYYTFDNARPVTASLAVEHYFKGNGQTATLAEYNAGTAQRWLPLTKSSGKLFGCKVGNGSTFPSSDVTMTVWDNTMTSESCKVKLTLVDNQNACGTGSSMTISGMIGTERDAKALGVGVMLSAVLPEFPKNSTTDINGAYTFKNLPIGASYTVTPTLNKDHINGVNTLDLLKIQKHILALDKFDSPYKMIAADVDNDQVIRVNDLVELRKLILGVYSVLPNNQSWRFVASNQTMSTSSPWPFNEIMTHADLKENKAGSNFVAVKVGDVDGSATTSAVSDVTEPRNVGITLKANDRKVRNGETVEIELEAENFNQVYGFQLSTNLKGLTLVGAEGRGIDLDATNVASPKQGIMTMSWNNSKGSTVAEGSKVMILTFKATEDGSLSEMLQLSSAITRAEAYVGEDLEVSKIQLSFRNDKKFGFALDQNTPNPWKGETSVAYVVPESGAANFTVYDITGKVLFARSVNAVKGENQLSFTKSELRGATGVMIYKIEAGQYTAQKKMIVID